MNLSEFKTVVDQAISQRNGRDSTSGPPLRFSDHKAESAHLRELLGGSTLGVANSKLLVDFMHEVAVRHAAFGDALQPYRWVAMHLRDALRAEPSMNKIETSNWVEAIQYVIDNEATSIFVSAPDTAIARPIEIGRAIRTLADANFSVEIVGTKVEVSSEAFTNLQKEFDGLAAQIGGAQLVHSIFQSIAPTLNAITKRFHIVRSADFTGTKMLTSQVPWGYLLQLGMKHMNSGGDANWQPSFARLLSLSTAGIAIFDVQPYNPYETMMVDQNSILEYLQNGTTYDAIFTIPQLNPDHAKIMYHGLFTDAQKKTLQFSGVRLETALNLADLILEAAHPEELTQLSDVGELANRLGFGKSKTAGMIDSIFAWAESAPNQELGYPPYFHHMDSMFRPLCKHKNHGYVIPPKSVCALGLFEAIMTLARNADANVDSRIGNAIEDLIKTEFSKKGVRYKSGNYNFRPTKSSTEKNLESDCDLIVETKKRIVFLECKKKSLTRLARSGDQVRILSDLSNSLVYSQVQAMQHETLLREESEFMLSDPEKGEVRLELNDRQVERVSVSLLDYDSLQDTSSLQRFLEICCQVKFSHPDPDQQKILDAVSLRFIQLKDFAERIGQLGNPNGRLFSGSTFTCVPKILLILERVTDEESFWTEMGRTKNIVSGTRDFYADYAYWAGIAASLPSTAVVDSSVVSPNK